MEKRIPLYTKDTIYFVSPDEILYCKCNNTSTTFYLQNGTNIIISKGIKAVEQMLQGGHFIRSHQSYLVNKKYISHIDKSDNYTLVLENKHRLPTSSRRRKEILETLKIGI